MIELAPLWMLIKGDMKRLSLLVGDRVGEALTLYHTNLVTFPCLRRNNRTMKKRYISMI